mmetsp:Transcript_4776/g.7261  ORF Transcript_4776/g.7261 Transcript_4776/m.7261 type:complete len:145 (+) Transcript_4776:42-476(+)
MTKATMRLLSNNLTKALAGAAVCYGGICSHVVSTTTTVTAFTPPTISYHVRHLTTTTKTKTTNNTPSSSSFFVGSPSTTVTKSTPCADDENDSTTLIVPDLVSSQGSANILRQAILTNVKGERVMLGDSMGSDTSIVVFLRHLA